MRQKKNWNRFLFKYLFKIKDGAFRFHKVLLRAFFPVRSITHLSSSKWENWENDDEECAGRKRDTGEIKLLKTVAWIHLHQTVAWLIIHSIMLIVFPWTKPSSIRFAKLFSRFLYFSRLNLNKCIAMGFFPFQVIKCFSGDRRLFKAL